jgi:DNA-directed RNA polymerase specialized sigma24 family protein
VTAASNDHPDLDLARRCLEGRIDAWEELVTRLERPVHTLAARFVWSLDDAQDVSQEVLLKVFTALHSYRGEAALTTWAYRIAARHLMDLSRRPVEALTFGEGREHLLAGLREPEWLGPEAAALAEEVKIGCSTSMLLCLSRPLRLSYLLGAVLDLPGPDAAWVLDVDPEVHRKRLSLARGEVREFMAAICGLYDPANPCRCHRQIAYDVRIGRLDADRPAFLSAGTARRARVLVSQLDSLHDDLAIMRSNPDLDPKRSVLLRLRELVASGAQPLA